MASCHRPLESHMVSPSCRKQHTCATLRQKALIEQLMLPSLHQSCLPGDTNRRVLKIPFPWSSLSSPPCLHHVSASVCVSIRNALLTSQKQRHGPSFFKYHVGKLWHCFSLCMILWAHESFYLFLSLQVWCVWMTSCCIINAKVEYINAVCVFCSFSHIWIFTYIICKTPKVNILCVNITSFVLWEINLGHTGYIRHYAFRQSKWWLIALLKHSLWT